MANILSHTTPEVFNLESGRVDARRFAEYLHIGTVEISSILGVNDRTLRKTPDSRTIQEPLKKLLRVVDGLNRLTGHDDSQVRIWLNAPHPDLGGISPLDLMQTGKIQGIVDLVEDMLTGAPA
ncbi:MAG: antitoxin Xre/MbcA/ParS toxin-binding domain-containing protein [Trueperaceae bacterium]|jgi:uncharacterized protein (DUF2384 family)|nr:antitoxin Xre/MbcA/ParS toxin-binding domain-containing protein [Truepera sp.]HRN17943.1 DUF2384 domain-containing protein [Trueperaceae bacterium]HRQ10158.1 DUF2384 domain-containing protein [Trueperaceae bacterium]